MSHTNAPLSFTDIPLLAYISFDRDEDEWIIQTADYLAKAVIYTEFATVVAYLDLRARRARASLIENLGKHGVHPSSILDPYGTTTVFGKELRALFSELYQRDPKPPVLVGVVAALYTFKHARSIFDCAWATDYAYELEDRFNEDWNQAEPRVFLKHALRFGKLDERLLPGLLATFDSGGDWDEEDIMVWIEQAIHPHHSAILVVPTCAKDFKPLIIGEAVRAIQASFARTAWTVSIAQNARIQELMAAVEDVRPRVIHLTGHGSDGKVQLIIGKTGRSKTVEASKIALILQAARKHFGLESAVVVACHSVGTAQKMADVVGWAIGFDGTLMEDAAVVFSGELYTALAKGFPSGVAFDAAKAGTRAVRGDQDFLPVMCKAVEPVGAIISLGHGISGCNYSPATSVSSSGHKRLAGDTAASARKGDAWWRAR